MSTEVESKHSQQLSVNQIEENVETLFFDLVKKQSVSNRINQHSLVNQDDSTAGYSESVQDKVQPKYKERNLPRSRVKCDIVILMDSNRRLISKKGEVLIRRFIWSHVDQLTKPKKFCLTLFSLGSIH